MINLFHVGVYIYDNFLYESVERVGSKFIDCARNKKQSSKLNVIYIWKPLVSETKLVINMRISAISQAATYLA